MLIFNSKINIKEVFKIYDQAFAMAQKKKSVPGGDDILDELSEILGSTIANWNLKSDFDKYYQIFSNWQLPQNLEPEQAYKCISFQAAIMEKICTAQLLNYKTMSIDYKNYLSDKIDNEIRNISNKDTQQAVSYYLQNQSGQTDIVSELENPKLLSLSTIQLIKKHSVMITAIQILNGSGEDPIPKLTNFYEHLRANKADLIVSRKEPGFKTFLKGLGVTAATIFGFGIGGYVAYQKLFCNSQGKQYFNKTEALEIITKKP